MGIGRKYLEKANGVNAAVLVLLFLLPATVLADGYDSSKSSHQTLYADTLTSKTDGSPVRVADSEGLLVTGDLKALSNIDVGVTDHVTWHPNYKVLQIGDYTALGDLSTGYTVLGNNYYEDSTNHRHVHVGLASYYRQSGGTHQFVVTNISPGAGGIMERIHAMIIDSNGNVGIGTTLPTAKIHIGGTAGVDGIKFPDGTLQTTAAGGGSSQWVTSGSNIYYNSGNVGIGIANPIAKLSVIDAPGATVLNTESTEGYRIALRPDMSGVGNIMVAKNGAVGTQLSFTTQASNGSTIERMRIDSSGNVGIGTTTPGHPLQVYSSNDNNVQLHIEGIGRSQIRLSTPGKSWKLEAENTVGNSKPGQFSIIEDGVSPRIVIQNNTGNVGIGTISPAAKLEVYNGDTYLQATSIGNSGSHYQEIGYNLGFTDTSNQYTYRYTDTAASIRLGYSADSQGGGIEFRTASGGTGGSPLTLSNKMFISNSGNVGIGISSPSSLLHLSKTSGQDGLLVDSGSVRTMVESSSGGSIGFIGTVSMHPMGFVTGNSEKVRIDSSGNFGIGSTNPGSKATVAGGDVYISSLGSGIIMKDTVLGTCKRVVLANGAFSFTDVTCPST